MTSAVQPGQHIAALDGIRGVAVLGVVAHHLGHLTGGYLGVDAFFVLSGFLITGLLLDETSVSSDVARSIDLQRFWLRRAKRLLPAFFVVLATVVVVERWWIDDGISDSTLRAESLSSLFYVFNWQAIANDIDYWATFSAVSPLRHMWSLAIEEQFYVVWPVVVAAIVWIVRRGVATARRTHIVIAATALILAVGSLVAQQVVYDPDDALRVYYGTDTRIAAILFGAIAAFVVRRIEAPSPGVQRWLGVGAVVVSLPVAWAWIALDGTSTTLYRGGMAAVGLATAIVIAVASLAPRSLLATVLSAAPLRWVGTISYGLYLWHWPMIVWLTPERLDVHGWPLMVVRLAASLALTSLSYHLVEQPIRRARSSGRRAAAWAAPTILGLGMLTVGVTAGASPLDTQPEAGTRSTAPIPTRPATSATATTIAHEPVVADPRPVTDDGAVGVVPAVTTTAAVLAEPQRIMVVGDSGAYFLGELLVSASDAESTLVLPRGEIGCGIVNASGGATTDDGALLPDPEGCEDWPQRWSDDAGIFEPDVSLLVLSWPGIGNRDLTDFGGRAAAHPCDADFDRHYGDRVALALASAGSAGGRVVIATTPYYSGPGADRTFVERVDCLNRVMTMTATTHDTDIVDLAAWTCPDGRCRTEIDGVPLRPDGLHFEGDGGLLAAAWVLEQLVPT